MIGQSTADPAETAAIGLGTTAHTGGARYLNHMSYYDLFHRKFYEIFISKGVCPLGVVCSLSHMGEMKRTKIKRWYKQIH